MSINLLERHKENAAEQAHKSNVELHNWVYSLKAASILCQTRYWMKNMPIIEAGCEVAGQNDGKRENCFILYLEGTSHAIAESGLFYLWLLNNR